MDAFLFGVGGPYIHPYCCLIPLVREGNISFFSSSLYHRPVALFSSISPQSLWASSFGFYPFCFSSRYTMDMMNYNTYLSRKRNEERALANPQNQYYHHYCYLLSLLAYFFSFSFFPYMILHTTMCTLGYPLLRMRSYDITNLQNFVLQNNKI